MDKKITIKFLWYKRDRPRALTGAEAHYRDMKRALSSSRCSYLAPPAHPLLPHLVRPLLPSSSFSVGSSKDLDSSPAPRHFSSSSSSSSLPTHETRPRPTRAQREATTKKYERKEERKATKELKSVEKEAREQAFEQGRREELEAKRATSDVTILVFLSQSSFRRLTTAAVVRVCRLSPKTCPLLKTQSLRECTEV